MKPFSPPASPPSPPPAQAAAPPRTRGLTAALPMTTKAPSDRTLPLTPPHQLSPGFTMEGPPPPAPKKARRGGARCGAVVITMNNPTVDADRRLRCFLADTHSVCYAVCGREVGASGTPHLQAFACAPNSARQRSITSWRTSLSGCHVEPMKGTVEQNENYCKKVINKKLLF